MIMENFWRYRKEIAVILITIFFLLFLVHLIQSNFITKNLFVDNKDVIDGLSKILSAAVLIIGAIFSYFKFFKGRIFKEKLLINISSKLIDNKENNLHVIDVELKNIGDTAIWYPNETIQLIYIANNGTETISNETPNSPDEKLDKRKNIFLIEPQEVSYRHFTKFLPTEILALTFKIDIISNRGNKWSKSITIENKKTATNIL